MKVAPSLAGFGDGFGDGFDDGFGADVAGAEPAIAGAERATMQANPTARDRMTAR
jgi:hypothetical protein